MLELHDLCYESISESLQEITRLPNPSHAPGLNLDPGTKPSPSRFRSFDILSSGRTVGLSIPVRLANRRRYRLTPCASVSVNPRCGSAGPSEPETGGRNSRRFTGENGSVRTAPDTVEKIKLPQRRREPIRCFSAPQRLCGIIRPRPSIQSRLRYIRTHRSGSAPGTGIAAGMG